MMAWGERERERLVSQLDRTMDLRKMGSLCAANHSGGEAGFWGACSGAEFLACPLVSLSCWTIGGQMQLQDKACCPDRV